MATLSSYINYPEVKSLYRARYSSNGYFVNWANQLLEELQERRFLSPVVREVGIIAHDSVWIQKPSDIVSLIKIYDPLNPDREFRVNDVNGEYRLLDDIFDTDYSDLDTIESFSTHEDSYSDSYTRCNYGSKADGVLKGYLLYVVTGNNAGQGYVISTNFAVNGDYPQINFVNKLPTTLAENDITSALLIPPERYSIIKYNSIITKISDVDDEVPIPDDCEERLVPTWLRWCCEREVSSVSKETVYWEAEKDKLLNQIEAKRVFVNKAKGRKITGLSGRGYNTKSQPSYDDCVS